MCGDHTFARTRQKANSGRSGRFAQVAQAFDGARLRLSRVRGANGSAADAAGLRLEADVDVLDVVVLVELGEELLDLGARAAIELHRIL